MGKNHFHPSKWTSRSSNYLYLAAGLFTCRDGFAVPYDYKCNGIGDCSDGSDEDPQFAGCQGNWTVYVNKILAEFLQLL